MSLKNRIKILKRERLEDSRGWFLKVINGKEEGLGEHVGEVYLTSAKENYARGNHYHGLATEWFTLIQGKATLLLKDIESMELLELSLDANVSETIVVPPKVAHTFINNETDDFLLLAYTNRHYDSKDTIAYILDKD